MAKKAIKPQSNYQLEFLCKFFLRRPVFLGIVVVTPVQQLLYIEINVFCSSTYIILHNLM